MKEKTELLRHYAMHCWSDDGWAKMEIQLLRWEVDTSLNVVCGYMFF